MITPLEIQNKVFKKSFAGYNREEVDIFLENILKSYENIYKENIELKDKIGLLSEQVSKYNNLEETLKDTLVLAQSTADEVTKSARKKSDLIIEEADIRAKEELWKSEIKVEKVNNEYEKLRNEMTVFKNKYLYFLKAQISSIEEFTKIEGLKEDDS